MDYVPTKTGRSRSIVKHNGFRTSKQNRLSISGDSASLHVGSLHRSGKKLVAGIFVFDFGFAIARVRIASVLQWIMAPWALPPCKTAAIRAPSKSDERIKDSGPRARNLMNVSRILLFAFSVFARLSFCSFWFVFRIRRMSEGICFFLVDIANRLQRFCSCGGPFLCLFS